MYPYLDFMTRHMTKEISAQYQHEAEVDHLLAQSQPRPAAPSAQPLRRALHNLGHVLVAVGRRLDARSV